MDRDDVLRLQYFREYLFKDHLDRIDLDEYVKHHAHRRRDLHVSSVKLSLRDELRSDA